ncbi:MAG TPA: hypothetical protein V6C72_04170 [Chroococcales cyanobacterium]
MLNDKQKSAIWLGALLAISMGCYPPWKELGPGGNPAPYALIFQPPLAAAGHGPVGIDYSRLLLQWSMVGFLVGALITSAADQGEKHAPKPSARPQSFKSSQPIPTEYTTVAEPAGSASAAARTEPQPGTANSEPMRTLTFPGGASIGEVLVESSEDPDYWDFVAHARGQVEVPANLRLQLEVSKEPAVDLSGLAALAENAFHSVDLSHTTIKDEDLVHIARQKDLQELDLSDTQITDRGVEHIVKLPGLMKLWLDKTQITDQSLAELKKIKGLAKLSLTGTDITESEINRMKSEFPQQCEIILANGNQA